MLSKYKYKKSTGVGNGGNAYWEAVYDSEKPIECTFSGCLARFTTEAALESHLRYHSDEKPFKVWRTLYLISPFLMNGQLGPSRCEEQIA